MTPEQILDFWFAGDPGMRRVVWFKKTDAFDVECAQFSEAVAGAPTGAYDDWAATPLGALALLILLDQLPRNLHRGSALAFAGDEKARSVARAAIGRGFDRDLTVFERMFMYLPFEHSEDLADQDESVRLFELLRGGLEDDPVRYAQDHRAVIRRFGRFPHRNAALGRTNTPEEEKYLAQPGAGF
jgi:uncharacterized protein (DUF924 family)